MEGISHNYYTLTYIKPTIPVPGVGDFKLTTFKFSPILLRTSIPVLLSTINSLTGLSIEVPSIQTSRITHYSIISIGLKDVL